MEWVRYLDEDVNAFHREDAYMAQIAAEIRRGNVKHPSRVKNQDMMLKFTTRQEKRQSTPEESKNFWMSALGLKQEK